MNSAMDPGLAPSQLDVFSIIERACSGASLIGSVVVIATFCASKAFHKPINRLVFYASFGNLMTNVATLMARSFISDTTSAGCQFQAFLIQMFMPADTCWTLAMAVNVYLTFYFKFDGQRLRKMEIPYLLLCYGVPFIVALTFIFVSSPEKGRMYGNATLWCWISPRWDIFRILLFYGPVWIVILITFFIYIRAGREIYKKHKQLKEFSTGQHDPEPLPALDDLFVSTKTTEVFVTTEAADKGAIDLAPLGGGGGRRGSQVSGPKPPKAAYSVTISSNRREANRESYGDIELPIQSNIAADTQSKADVRNNGGSTGVNPLRRRAAYEASNATWSYTKCAILFFTAMLVTWIPSSANRVYSVIHQGQASLALEYMSAFVLPLQGFWNAIIYLVTSWKAVQMLWDDMCAWWPWGGSSGRRRPNAQELVPGRSAFQMMSSGRNGSKASDAKVYETESMTELAGSRPGSSSGPATPMDAHPGHLKH
ncbi:G-protein coupled receptors family 2 profile 2 domain-containing protein [Madurella fahalii]|uniref:G-protein coupled receptors family 2 profile 2 domain-containing protein n=1 Tax=Madurella fahalii TaxID=1157608 RepID=A0ABQ0GAT4_9PEZI